MVKRPNNKPATTKPKPNVQAGEPKLPYCTKPNALRRFLKLVPSKPKPPKVNNDLLAAWDLGGHNANSIIRVLRGIGLIDSSNQPSNEYITFMDPKHGPGRLGHLIRQCFAPLFEASHAPHKESDETLKRLFNIHSGGAERTLQYQVTTFKTLCEFANFDSAEQPVTPGTTGATNGGTVAGASFGAGMNVHIDLHIHLPPNKNRRDYEYMFEDIGRYIYGKSGTSTDGQ
jgi:hypothetical protein